MLRTIASALRLVLWAGLTFSLLHGRAFEARAAAASPARRTVYLAGGLSDERLIVASAAVAAGDPSAVLLLDSPASRPALKAFLARFQPERFVLIGSFPAGAAEVERSLGVTASRTLTWERGPPTELWKSFFPRAERVVVCPAEPRRILLQCASLAGALRAPLVVIHAAADQAADLRERLASWDTREVFAAGDAIKLARGLQKVRVIELPDERAVAQRCRDEQRKKSPVRALVVTNPADAEAGRMAVLAPWIATRRHAVLLLTDETGSNVANLVRTTWKQRELEQADTLILVGDLQAIPMERRPNPAQGKDRDIEMEPLTPTGTEPFTLATGRLFHKDPAVVLLMLARERLLASSPPRHRALVASNPGGSLPLLEIFSRHTARELHNTGYQTTALFGAAVEKDKLRRLLPEQEIFLWEGHYKTMVDEYGLPGWTEPLAPSLVFLQSCLALNEKEAQPLLHRGALGVVGSSSRNYSASGGAFTLAFFDALLYKHRSLGASLREAKNFLLTYALLKEKRLGKAARLSGANLRSAWAFTLWGDPTLELPRAEPPDDALDPVRYDVRDSTIVISLPDEPYERVTTGKYSAQMFPNSRLAGLVRPDGEEDSRQLVPFAFAEISLPRIPAGKVPRLSSRLPERNWVFNWDARRRSGYLLVALPSRGGRKLRFEVDWDK